MADEERTPWARFDDEPGRWFARFEAFRQFGPTRSLLGTVSAERAEKGGKRRARKVPGAWDRAAKRFRWRERAEAWDRALEAQVAADEEERRRRILSTGYAMQHQRVEHLVALADVLHGDLLVEEHRWCPDVKGIGRGETFERVDLVRFNASLVEQYRKTLDDIAAELGQRQRNVDVTSGGRPLPTSAATVVITLPDNGRGDRIDTDDDHAHRTAAGEADTVPIESG